MAEVQVQASTTIGVESFDCYIDSPNAGHAWTRWVEQLCCDSHDQRREEKSVASTLCGKTRTRSLYGHCRHERRLRDVQEAVTRAFSAQNQCGIRNSCFQKLSSNEKGKIRAIHS